MSRVDNFRNPSTTIHHAFTGHNFLRSPAVERGSAPAGMTRPRRRPEPDPPSTSPSTVGGSCDAPDSTQAPSRMRGHRAGHTRHAGNRDSTLHIGQHRRSAHHASRGDPTGAHRQTPECPQPFSAPRMHRTVMGAHPTEVGRGYCRSSRRSNSPRFSLERACRNCSRLSGVYATNSGSFQ